MIIQMLIKETLIRLFWEVIQAFLTDNNEDCPLTERNEEVLFGKTEKN